MAAVQDRKVAQRDIPSSFEGDGLVSLTVHRTLNGFWIGGAADGRTHAQRPVASRPCPACARPAPREPTSVNQSGTHDRNVLDIHPPDQTVLPVAVAEVLIEVGGIRLGCVVSSAVNRRVAGNEHRAWRELQRDVASETDGEREVTAGGKRHDATAGGGCGIDCGIDGDGVCGSAVSFGAVRTHVENEWRGLRRGERRAEQRNRDDQNPRHHVIPLRATAAKPGNDMSFTLALSWLSACVDCAARSDHGLRL